MTRLEFADFEIGERAIYIVGLPGPDVEYCTVVSGPHDDGTYTVRCQVNGRGEFFEQKAFPGVRRVSGLFKIEPRDP